MSPARDSGLIARIARRLGLHWGTRGAKYGGRPFVFDQTIDRRATFNANITACELKQASRVTAMQQPRGRRVAVVLPPHRNTLSTPLKNSVIGSNLFYNYLIATSSI